MKLRIQTLSRPSLPPTWLAGWQSAGEQASQYWKQLSARERRLLRAMGLFVMAAAFFAIALRPAWRQIAQWQDQLPQLRVQAAAVDSLVQEAQALKREQGSRIPAADMQEALRSSLARAGWGGTAQVDKLEDGKAWRIAFDGISPTALFDWVAYAPGLLHLRVDQAHIVRPRDALGRPIPARVSGTLRLHDNDATAAGGRP